MLVAGVHPFHFSLQTVLELALQEVANFKHRNYPA